MSFRLKTILGIALIELTIMVVLIGVNQFKLGGSVSTQLYERAEATARIFANAVADPVIATDLATLDATVATAVSNEEVTYLRVLSPTGIVLAEGGDPAALGAFFLRDPDFETATSDHMIDIDVPIVVTGTRFGTVELGMSTVAVEAQIAEALRWNVLVAIIGMSLVAIFGYLLGTILTRQLKGLQEGARTIASGDLDHQIDVLGKDELGETALCFNEMAQTLSKDRAALQAQKDALLDKKERVEVLVGCLNAISKRQGNVYVPETKGTDEIGDMARATVVFQNTMAEIDGARMEQQRLISAFDQLDEHVAIFGETGKLLFANTAFRIFYAEIFVALKTDFSLGGFFREGLSQGVFLGVENKDDWLAEQLAQNDGTPREIRHAPDRILLTSQSRIDGIGTVLSSKDVTELRNSELQLIQASKLATLGEMATGIAHELNQPLGVIRMAATNCVKRIDRDKADMDYLRGKLVRVGEQTERASQIIDHMRVFGRKADDKPSVFNLFDSLVEMMHLAQTQLRNDDIELTMVKPEGTAFVSGQIVMFEQVLLNLISNARDAIEAHRSTDGAITVSAQFNTPHGHIVEIQDNGGGVPEEILDKLFEPFFTTKDPGKGTGLGLSIGFGTIREMQGTLSVANKNGGACFTITLPAAEPQSDEGTQAA